MKIISLNIWGGRISTKMLDFFRNCSDVDIFILQEVFHNATDITAWHPTDRREIFKEISEVLVDYNGYFAPVESNEWGLALFVKKQVVVEEVGDIFVHRRKDSMVGKDGSTLGKNIQYLKVGEGKGITVINFHGLWNGKGKSDTEDRINQSKRIVEFVKNITHDIILGGDFNLRPDTESLKMLERDLNLRNLISDYNITSTRTSLYPKEEKFADYMLVSPGIKVKDFKVLPDEVSDHSPLYLEFEM